VETKKKRKKQSAGKFNGNPLMVTALHPRVRFVGKVLRQLRTRTLDRTFSQKGPTTVLRPMENHCQPTRVCKVSHYTNTYVCSRKVMAKSADNRRAIVASFDERDERSEARSVEEAKTYATLRQSGSSFDRNDTPRTFTDARKAKQTSRDLIGHGSVRSKRLRAELLSATVREVKAYILTYTHTLNGGM